MTAFAVSEIETDLTTDRVLAGRVGVFLRNCHLPGLLKLNVQVHDGVVTLSGRVKSFYEKQVYSRIADRVPGIVRLVDNVTVD